MSTTVSGTVQPDLSLLIRLLVGKFQQAASKECGCYIDTGYSGFVWFEDALWEALSPEDRTMVFRDEVSVATTGAEDKKDSVRMTYVTIQWFDAELTVPAHFAGTRSVLGVHLLKDLSLQALFAAGESFTISK